MIERHGANARCPDQVPNPVLRRFALVFAQRTRMLRVHGSAPPRQLRQNRANARPA